MKQHGGSNALLIAFSIVYCMAMVYPNQQMFFYYKELFGSKDAATQLVNIYAFMYGIAGFVCALGGGKLCDRLGLQKFTGAPRTLCSRTRIPKSAGRICPAQGCSCE